MSLGNSHMHMMMMAPVMTADYGFMLPPLGAASSSREHEQRLQQATAGTTFEVPALMLDDSVQRDVRCAHALRVTSLDQLEFRTDDNAHVLASVLGAHCTECVNWRACTHIKAKFNSTHNSKRRVHTHLFWKRCLGLNFPVTDSMLRDNVWKNLESCDCGVKRANGHAKQAGYVCINPHHYQPVDYNIVLNVLIEALIEMDIYPKHLRITAIASLRCSGVDPRIIFEALCEEFQQMTAIAS